LSYANDKKKKGVRSAGQWETDQYALHQQNIKKTSVSITKTFVKQLFCLEQVIESHNCQVFQVFSYW
jgi:hypothetical protein